VTAERSRMPRAEDSAFAGAHRWTDADGMHIDVRGLPPPSPLVAILALVETAPPGSTIVVHHDRDPLLLHPELAELGWAAERIDAPAGEVRLRLARVE